MRRSYAVRIIDRPTNAALFTTIRFRGNARGCPFETGPGLMVGPVDDRDPDTAYARLTAYARITARVGALAELLDARRRRRR